MAENKDDDHGFGPDEEDVAEEEGSTLMTTLLAGAAVAIFAPELLPGMAIGVAAMLAPRILPMVGGTLRPLMKTAVRAGYSAAITAREVAAEAGEQVQDMVAEARAAQTNGRPATKARGARKSPKRRARA
jgi:hypothetical protein